MADPARAPSTPTPITPLALPPDQAQALLERIAANVEVAVKGQRDAVRLALVALCAQGHLLLEGPPGAGKTTLAQSLARSLDLSFSRVQFTSDLMPTDILGATIFDPRQTQFEFRKGPIFAQVVLADELNRAPPRVQSALLEALAEGQVSTDAGTQILPRPFFVVATQNPREHAGTFPLPDAQLDRFALRLSLGYPSSGSEQDILMGRQSTEPWKGLSAVAGAREVQALQAATSAVTVAAPLAAYVVALAEKTRSPGFAQGGLSTRAALGVLAAARAMALWSGRGHVLPDDVKAVARSCMAHRLTPVGSDGLESTRLESERMVERLLVEVQVPL
jgi:MoxR-like ATPase